MPQEAATVTRPHFLLGKLEVSCGITRNAEPYFSSISQSRRDRTILVGGVRGAGGGSVSVRTCKCASGEEVHVSHTQSCARQSRRMKDKGCHRKAATVTKDSPFSLFLVDALFLDLCIYWSLQLLKKCMSHQNIGCWLSPINNNNRNSYHSLMLTKVSYSYIDILKSFVCIGVYVCVWKGGFKCAHTTAYIGRQDTSCFPTVLGTPD